MQIELGGHGVHRADSVASRWRQGAVASPGLGSASTGGTVNPIAIAAIPAETASPAAHTYTAAMAVGLGPYRRLAIVVMDCERNFGYPELVKLGTK